MNTTRKEQICFICLDQLQISYEDEVTESDFDVCLRFIGFSQNYLKLKPNFTELFLTFSKRTNPCNVFCFTCKSVIQKICDSYQVLLQSELRLSWHLGEVETLIKKSNRLTLEKKGISELAENPGVLDFTSVETMRELFLATCVNKSNQFQPQLVLTQKDATVVSSMHNVASFAENNEVITDNLESDEINDKGLVDILDFDSNPSVKNEHEAPVFPSTSLYEKPIYSPFLIDGELKMEAETDLFDELPFDIQYDVKNLQSVGVDGDEVIIASGIGNTDIPPMNEELKSEFRNDGLNWQCCFCWKSFKTSGTLQLHANSIHADSQMNGTEAGAFPCEVEGCQKNFKSHVELTSHLNVHSQELCFCKICKWGFINHDLLQLHELVHIKPVEFVGKRVFFCPKSICKYSFSSIERLQNHYNMRHGVALKRFKCSECTHVSTSRYAVMLHKRRIHLEKKETDQKLMPIEKIRIISLVSRDTQSKLLSSLCNECGAGFKNLNALKLHQLKHLKTVQEGGTGRGMYHCPEIGCLYAAIQVWRLQDHYNVRHGTSIGRYKCGKCAYVCPSKESIRYHIRTIHSVSNVEKKCRTCKLLFNNSSALVRHRNNLHQERVCRICNEAFIGRFEFRTHIRLQHPNFSQTRCNLNQELTFSCLTCNKSFSTAAKLGVHKKESHGEKVHKCEVCNYLFRTKSQLAQHRKRNHNSVLCSYCGKIFRCGSLVLHNLYQHLDKAASDNGQHRCPHCPLRYSQKQFLHRHILLCHPDAPENLKCRKCGYAVENGRTRDFAFHQLSHLSTEERKLQKK